MNINIPENIRRIGENSSDYKMYIEDYVVTFLNRLSTKKEGRLLAVSLYGKIDRQEDANYFLVMGAAELGEREEAATVFTDEDMMQSQAIQEKYFNEYDMLGWAVLEGGGTAEQFMLYESGNSAFIDGYYIFYDKNEGMQSYLVNWNAFCKKGNTEYANERAVRQFRTIYRNRKEEKNERHIISLLYMTTLMLLIFCCVMGISMMNNYEKMKGMEEALHHLAFAMEEQKLPDVMRQSVVEEKEVISSSVITEGNPELVEQTISQNTVEAVVENKLETVSHNEMDKPKQEQTNTLQVANDEETTHAVYIVQKGDTLLQISKRFYNRLDMVDEICHLNGIENPNDIMQQQKILLP